MSATSGDGGVQASCTTVPLGKSVRRALRAAIGMQKPKPKDKAKKKKPPPQPPPPPCGGDPGTGGASMELSRSSSVAARKEAVVRVVTKGGVVEVYPGVVLACTVIRKHPPGLCLAHPDVFRNPHGAVVRPLEPLFPGQKFLLIPESTVVRLKRQIPESSIGAFADEEYDDEADEEGEDGEEVAASSSEEFSSGGGAVSSPEDEAAAACSARDYFVAKDRWSECRLKQLVEQGLAVAPSKNDDDDEPERKQQEKGRNKKGGSNKKKRKLRRRRDRLLPPLPVGLRGFATARRTWEPSLPSVVEEEATVVVSPLHPPPESEEAAAPQDGHEQ